MISGQMQILGTDGSILKTITTPTKSGWVLDWSAAGKVLYVASGGADADEELYALDVASNTFTQLTDDDLRQLFAAWSPGS